MRPQWLYVCLLLAACDQLHVGETEQALTGGGEFSPASFGALPDDGADDRAGLQAAVQAACDAGGGIVRLQAGLYELSANPQPGASKLESLAIRCSNVRLTGEGISTVLQATGDGGAGDWNLVQIRTSPTDPQPVRNIEIDNLLLSGSGAWNTDEQTHLLEIGVGPVESVSLHHLWFYHPVRQKQDLSGNERGGDCIRIMGGPDKAVRFTQITDSQFLDCDRSSIGFQREVYDTIIDSNVFLTVGDQHIDQEPTGEGALGRMVVSNNLFMGGTQGAHSVTLTGNSIAEPSSEIIFSHNVLFGRGLALLNVQRAVVSDNVIVARIATGEGVIQARKANVDVILRGNHIERAAGSEPGPVVSVVPHNTGFPSRWKIEGNQLVSAVDGYGLNLESISNVSISDNDFALGVSTDGAYALTEDREFTIAGTGPYTAARNYDFRADSSSSSSVAIRLMASQGALGNVLINGNRSVGPLAALVQLTPAPYAIGAVSIVGNMASGAATGILCKGGGTFTRPIVHTGNYYDGASTSTSDCPSSLALVAQYP
ncbi:MAG TPA: hypothetical protein VKB80_31265 [Kofleriaceae bacterium]|nr:hypothetical protein [Kofleriaceae bacterium]